MDNGILQVTLSNPEGIVTGIQFQGIDNLLEVRNAEYNRGYFLWIPFFFNPLSLNPKMKILTGINYKFIIPNHFDMWQLQSGFSAFLSCFLMSFCLPLILAQLPIIRHLPGTLFIFQLDKKIL